MSKTRVSPTPETVDESKTKIQPPKMYKVLLLNDDYTPMDFVVEVLQRFFNMDLDKATHVMLAVHFEGKGVCGVYTADIAETKVDLKGMALVFLRAKRVSIW